MKPPSPAYEDKQQHNKPNNMNNNTHSEYDQLKHKKDYSTHVFIIGTLLFLALLYLVVPHA